MTCERLLKHAIQLTYYIPQIWLVLPEFESHPSHRTFRGAAHSQDRVYRDHAEVGLHWKHPTDLQRIVRWLWCCLVGLGWTWLEGPAFSSWMKPEGWNQKQLMRLGLCAATVPTHNMSIRFDMWNPEARGFVFLPWPLVKHIHLTTERNQQNNLLVYGLCFAVVLLGWSRSFWLIRKTLI